VLKLAARDDLYVLDFSYFKDCVIGRNQIICLGSQSRLKDGIVIWVAGNVPPSGGRQIDEFSHPQYGSAGQESVAARSSKILSKRCRQLVKDVFRNVKPHALSSRAVQKAVAIASF
jgi:hypothetical protein